MLTWLSYALTASLRPSREIAGQLPDVRGKFVHSAIVYLNFIKFFASGSNGARTSDLSSTVQTSPEKFIVKRDQRSFRPFPPDR
jgi:hypothetical protein